MSMQSKGGEFETQGGQLDAPLVQRMTSSFRQVREHDETQAASARQLVRGALTVQTGNSVHTAEGHVKIDAEQIHLG